MRDRGSMLILVMFVGVAICSTALLAVMPVLDDLIDRQRATAAADSAALAGVTGGYEASATLAASNGARLVAWTRDGRQVTVRVRVGDQIAVARATDEP